LPGKYKEKENNEKQSNSSAAQTNKHGTGFIITTVK
jgi:hypothetical protein